MKDWFRGIGSRTRIAGVVLGLLLVAAATFGRQAFYSVDSTCETGVRISIVYTWKRVGREWVPDYFTTGCMIVPPGF